MNLILLEDPLHDLKELLLARIIDLLQFALDLMEPILNGIQLRTIGRQIQHVDPMLPRQIDGLLLIVDRAIVHHDPLLLRILLGFMLADLLEKLTDEVEVLELAVVPLDETPMRQTVVRDDGDQRETLSLRNWTVYCDLLVRTGPCLVSSHVEVEPRFVQKVHLCPALQNFLIFLTILIAFLQRLTRIFLLGDAFNPLLSELPHTQQLPNYSSGHILPDSAFDDLQILYFVQFHAQLILRKEWIFLYQSSYVLQPVKRQFSLRVFGLFPISIVTLDSLVEIRIVHPLRVQFVDRRMTELEHLPDHPQRDLLPIVIFVGLVCVIIRKFTRN